MKVLAILALGTSLTALPALAETQYVAADNSLATHLCIDAATKTPIAMLMSVKDSGLGYRFIANSVRCNDQAIGHFAAQAGNDRIAHQLLRRMNHRVEITDMTAFNNAVIEVRGQQ